MEKFGEIIKSWKESVKEASNEFVWFNKSKETEVDGKMEWINTPISMSDIPSILDDEDNWYVNIFMKGTDEAVEEVEQVKTELSEMKLEIVPETELKAKNNVFRFAIRRTSK